MHDHPTTSCSILTVLFIGSLIFSSCSFNQRTCKKLYEHALCDQYDAIIVPGVPFVNGSWSWIMKGRILWSKHLFDLGVTKNIVFSGSAVYTAYTEADIMALYATEIGIPAENIYRETKAEHSTENLYYSFYLSKQLGFKKVALASDPFQTKMLRRMARKQLDTIVDLIPFYVDSLKTMETQINDPVIDHEKLRKLDFVPITERESLWKRVRGTMGKNIDRSAYQ